ncbi:MAG: DNRLRE domain-containing protein [Bacteroidales bacterium]|nr:DNRLRE domain-containing protein [Bacteroidales bacterium]
MKKVEPFKKVLLYILTGFFCINSALAEEINLRGSIYDAESNPISGVRVYLKIANLTTYTNSGGYFEIIRNNDQPTSVSNSSISSNHVSFNGIKLLLHCQGQNLNIELFDITGRYIKQLICLDNVNGSYALYPASYLENLPGTIYLIRVSVDNEFFGFKIIKGEGTIFEQGLHAVDNPEVSYNSNDKSTEAIDSFIFTHDSFITRRVGINSYITDVGNITMYEDIINAPVLAAPSTTYSTFELTWTYNWSGYYGSDDHYELEYSYHPTSGFQVLINYPHGERTTPFTQEMQPEAQDIGKTTYFRVRAKSGGYYSDYSNVVGVYCPKLEQTILATLDNLMMYSSDDPNLANTNYKNASLGVGTNYIDGLYVDSWLVGSSSIFFDLMNLIEGRTIRKATLKLSVEYLPADINTMYIVNPFAGSWNTNTITMNNAPNYYTSYSATEYPPVTSAIPWEVDITRIVQAWANGFIPNNGILIRDYNVSFPYYTAYRATQFYSIETAGLVEYKPQIELIVE